MSIIIQGNTIVQGSVIFGYQLLLDVYSGAAAAYSLRKLSSTYSGSAIRVRRSSDNTEQDIGFDASNNLNEAALLSFVGAGSGFVTTWYDQSGNNRNATQTTQANQPRIVNAGVIEKSGSYSTIRFISSSSNFLSISNRPLTNATSVSFFSSTNYEGINNYEMLFVQSDGTTNANRFEVRRRASDNTAEYVVNEFIADSNFGTINVTNTRILISLIASGATMSAYINGLLDVTSTKNNINIGNFPALIGYRSSSFYFDGTIQEIIIYATDQSSKRVGIQNNINNYYQIYWQGNGQALLDQYQSAAAAYSVRALSSSYTGPLIRVRRSSDNSETDIYAIYDGSLDEASLTAFCGAGNGFITTWYDQSGNSNNLRQTTGADQPYIVLSGSIVKRNNKPYIVSLTNNTLAFTSEISSGIYSLWMTYEKSALGNLTVLLKDANSYHWLDYGLNQYVGNATINLITISSIYNQNVLYLHNTLRKVSSVSEIYRNGLLIGSANLAGSTANSTFFAPKSKAAAIICSELVLYNNDQTSNRVGIQNNINSYFSIY